MSQAETEFEQFAIYGFSFDYPRECRVEFNPKSRREAGDIVFHFPDRTKIYVSWGDLERATKKFQSVNEQADHSINALKKSGSVRNLERVRQDSISMHTHQASFNHVKLEEVGMGFFPSKRGTPRDAFSVHMHCEPSTRYFVIYGIFSGELTRRYEETLKSMATSMKCH